jgi:hypothetical protein
MMKWHNLILLFVVIIWPSKLFASYEITNGCEMALREILNLRLTTAQEILEAERVSSPENYYVDYLENYKDMVELYIRGDESSYRNYLERFENRLVKMKGKDVNSPFYDVVRAEMLAQTGLLNVINSDEIAGFLKILKANKLLKKNLEKYPDFSLNKKLYGVITVGIGNVPGGVKWAAKFFGFKGDTEEGFKYLETYKTEVEGRPGLFAESLIYMIFAYMIVADEQGAYEMLQQNYSDSIVTTLGNYLYANTLDRVGKTDESLEILNQVNAIDLEGGGTFYPIVLLNSKGKLNRLDKDADQGWLMYLENSKSENFKKESCNRLSLHYLLHNQNEKYEYYHKKIAEFPKAVMRADREAEVDFTKFAKINIEILKAHLLVNGGYFSRADSVLDNINRAELTVPEQVFYVLLEGQIEAGEGELEKALVLFNEAILKGSEISEHYAAESALLAGNLAYNNKDYSTATYYYKLCQTIKCENNVYRQNIHKTSKSQLRKLKSLSRKM